MSREGETNTSPLPYRPAVAESEHVREVFARFGLAVYQAQCFEREVVFLLSTKYAPSSSTISVWRFDELLDSNAELVLGLQVDRLTAAANYEPAFVEKLKQAVKVRNCLAHRYWWERAVEFTSPDGRAQMLVELREMRSLFDDVDAALSAEGDEWRTARGIDEGLVCVEMEKLLSGTSTPPAGRARRLVKKETLIGAYHYSFENGAAQAATTVILELDDHTYWTLCDCGLTYGPPVAEIDKARLAPLPQFSQALPAEINPRPKNATGWHYEIVLSSGSRLTVSPGEKGGKFAFKWKLRRSR